MVKYKVVKIINEYRIVVNAGAKDGIKSGDILEVFVVGQMVNDPDTNEELGTLDFIKAEIEIETVYPNMCICTNSIKTSNNPMSALSKAALSLYAEKKEPETLNVDMSQASGGLDDFDKKIKIGDLVRESLG